VNRVDLSEDELRALSEDGDDLVESPGRFQPADFSDASRASHRIFGPAMARLSRLFGGAREPFPPSIRVTVADALRTAASRNPGWVWVLQFTGQFRATALFLLVASPSELPPHSDESLAVELETFAREVAVAFRSSFGRSVAIDSAPLASVDELPVREGPSSGLVSVDFDLEAGRLEPMTACLAVEASFVRELAALVRQPEPRLQTTPSRARTVSAADDLEAAPPLVSPRPLPLDRPVLLAAEIGRSRLTLGDLMSLEIGQVVPLDRLAGEVATLVIGGRSLATGEVVVEDGHLAVKLMSLEPAAELAELLTSLPLPVEPAPSGRV
jgi:flagellar motor switch protein FliN/FliY